MAKAQTHWNALHVDTLWEGVTKEEYYIYRQTLPVRVLYNDGARVGAAVPDCDNGKWSWKIDNEVFLNVPDRPKDESKKVSKRAFNAAVEKYIKSNVPGPGAAPAP